MQNKKKMIMIGVGSVLLVVAVYFVFESIFYVSTDNAQVNAHMAMLSSKVNGTILKVFVDENQDVKAGEPLAQIDTSDYSNASEAAQAQVASLQARVAEAQTNLARASELFKERAVPRERLDEAQATFKDTTAKLKAAQAQLDQANLNVSYTKIIAPSDGTIARKSVEAGQFVPAGQPLFGFVSSKARWVTANLKETELKGVQIGQKVDVDVDAISGRSFEGVVESISPSTGAVFSLLPPDNATGNFTKVVQRVPVRIAMRDLSDNDSKILRAGLSAVVKIHVH